MDKTVGDEVTGGTVNQYGTFELRATKVGNDSSLQRIIRLAKEADANKAPIIKLAERWATWLVSAAPGIAGATWFVTGELIRAVTVLVVFCPCAFILATPTAVIAGIGNATRSGILVRSGDALQRFSEIDSIAFDKTGTLTYGSPEVVNEELKSIGVHPVLLTGDNEATALHIASQVGIEDVKPNMLPEEKMKVIKEYADNGKNICMTGDGINDALALKSACAGIAMGGVGSDIAVEAADAVLVSDNIEWVPHLSRTAQKCMKRINFSITVAMIWNVIAVILSILGVLNPVTAALVHNVGSVFVVISSALLITNRAE